jgi:hypothetical protein
VWEPADADENRITHGPPEIEKTGIAQNEDNEYAFKITKLVIDTKP